MIRSSTQVKALIRNKSAGNADKAQMLMRIYMMERFLERLSVSKYRDNFVLKSGMLVSSLLGADMRSTMDIDTTVRALPLTIEHAQEMLEDIIDIKLEDGVLFRITKSMPIMEGHEYEGVRFFLQGLQDKLRQTIKIDISTGDVITPSAVEYELPLILEQRTIGLWAYNPETLLAEKPETVMTRAEANTRMRDFYDIYMLTHTGQVEYNQANLKAAFLATCSKRGSADKISSFHELLRMIKTSPEMGLAWENYRRNNTYVTDLKWVSVVDTVESLISS